MVSYGRLVVTLLLCIFTIFCETKTSKKNKHLFALLGYLHGYKIGYDSAVQLPPIVPVIVLPTINQHQNVSILKTIYENQIPENKNDIHSPEKLVSGNSTDPKSEYEDIEVIKKLNSPECKENKEPIEESEDTLRQAINTTVDRNTTTVRPTLQTQNVTEVSIQLNVTESLNGTASITTENPVKGYPTAMYTNDFVTSIQLTTESVETTDLPPVDDNRWQNFTNINGSETKSTSTISRGGSYSAAVYDSNLINNLEFTTKVYEKDTYVPPVQDDRWQNFSTETVYENSGQFKPLAGLYFDGFLHRPLRKTGFFPRPNYIF